MLTIETVIERCLALDAGITVNSNWGERGLFYNPDHRLPKGIYLLTFKEKDGDNDRASKLDRSGIYRLNVGVGKANYRSLFGEPPKRPAAGGVVNTGHDFTQLDSLMPHPVYGWMSWVCVLNPSEQTLNQLMPMLKQSLAEAKKKFTVKVNKLEVSQQGG